jgi:diguanylate cyclase (GGDEF)-like protein
VCVGVVIWPAPHHATVPRPTRPVRSTKPSGNLFLSATSANVPHQTVRKTIWTIVIVIGLLILAMWAIVSVSLITSRQAALDAANLKGRNLMIAFREEIALVLRGVEDETNLLAERLRREHGNFDLYAWGQENLVASQGIAQVTLIAPDGKLRSTTIEAHPSAIDLSDRAHFRIHLDGKFHGLYIGQSVIGRIAVGVPFLPISRRVDAEDGTFLGVLVVLISPGALTTLHKSIDLGSHGAMSLAGLDNIIRARFSADSPNGTVGIGGSLAGGVRPAVIAEQAEGSFTRAGVIDGITRVFVYGRVGAYPLVVTVGLDLNQELAAWRSYAAMIIAVALGATLLLTGLMTYLIRQIFQDMAKARTAAQLITHTAQHDLLTGLPNRLLLNDRINQAIALAQRHEKKVVVLFLDLDGFKHINDSLGHPVGDQLLQSIAKRLVACVRGSDTVSRQGGDEFIVLLSEVERSEDAAIAAERVVQAVTGPHSIDQHGLQVHVAIAAGKLLQAVAEAHVIGDHELHITASMGVSVYPEDGLDADTLIQNADTAMYQAKENGRQSYQLFHSEMNVRAVERQSIEEDLRRALERHQFALHYQPIIDLTTGAITGAEALIRWTHPTRGMIPPLQFIPVAEDSGLMVPIGNWVLREACRQTQAWIEAGFPVETMAVNVSALEFRAENFLEGVFAILSETGLDPKSLELELTESVLMKRPEATAAILQTLREKGARVAIDDFGTGYSSLSYLRKFPLDALKIDQSFVRQIGTAGEDTAIVTAVIGMAHSLKLRVIAEGVETLEELAFLRAHQCDEVQGYYFSRPVPAEQFEKLLTAGIPEANCTSRVGGPGAADDSVRKRSLSADAE